LVCEFGPKICYLLPRIHPSADPGLQRYPGTQRGFCVRSRPARGKLLAEFVGFSCCSAARSMIDHFGHEASFLRELDRSPVPGMASGFCPSSSQDRRACGNDVTRRALLTPGLGTNVIRRTLFSGAEKVRLYEPLVNGPCRCFPAGHQCCTAPGSRSCQRGCAERPDRFPAASHRCKAAEFTWNNRQHRQRQTGPECRGLGRGRQTRSWEIARYSASAHRRRACPGRPRACR